MGFRWLDRRIVAVTYHRNQGQRLLAEVRITIKKEAEYEYPAPFINFLILSRLQLNRWFTERVATQYLS
ncbi:MAG: hypothetical protein RLZZ165_1830 [Bacteroidota bacterium]